MTRPRNAAPPHIAPEAEERYGHHIREALTTEGGHLAIGRGGFTLYFARGAYLSGHDCDTIKTACIAAGLPVIDSRALPFEVVCDLAVRGPMVAVGEPASPPPWGAFSYARSRLSRMPIARPVRRCGISPLPHQRRRESERAEAVFVTG